MKIRPTPEALWWQEDASTEQLAAFHAAAADLFDAEPWRHIPDERCRLFLTAVNRVPRTDIAVVTGQDGGTPGVRLFSGLLSHAAWLERSGDSGTGEGPAVPLHAALDFLPAEHIADELRAVVERKGWRIADATAWPVPEVVRSDGLSERWQEGGIAMLEAILRALVVALAEPGPWQQAWRDGSVHEALVSVTTATEGDLELRITTETPPSMTLFDGSDDALLAAFEELDWSRGLDSVDVERLAELERTLIGRLRSDAPELAPLRQHAGIELLLECVAADFGRPITELSAVELAMFVLELVPETVAVPARKAGSVIETLDGTLRWLSDRRPMRHAEECLAWLNQPDTVERLASALGNTNLFSADKRFFMGGLEAGFDMDSEAGREAWMARWRQDKMKSWRGGGADMSGDLPDSGLPKTLSTAQRKKRKTNRKSARKARKKNR